MNINFSKNDVKLQRYQATYFIHDTVIVCVSTDAFLYNIWL